MDETMRVKPTNPSSDANITADYVIIGTGAVGMAFADIILTESEASLILIDSYDKPGGHWNVAYPFVQLHQPASFYGVSSKELSTGRQEQGGLNDGYGELSSGPAILGYYDEIMRHQFLPSGRVQYFPMCDYQGDGYFRSKVSGKTCRAIATRKYVAFHSFAVTYLMEILLGPVLINKKCYLFFESKSTLFE